MIKFVPGTNCLVTLIADEGADAARVEFGHDGSISYHNFEPDPLVHGLMEAVRSVFFDNPLGAADVMITMAEKRTAALKERIDVEGRDKLQ